MVRNVNRKLHVVEVKQGDTLNKLILNDKQLDELEKALAKQHWFADHFNRFELTPEIIYVDFVIIKSTKDTDDFINKYATRGYSNA